MPFIRGRYHINPVMGEALEAAREAEQALLALEQEARNKRVGGYDDDETADGSQDGPRAAGPVHRVEIEATEVVPPHSGRAARGFVAQVHRAVRGRGIGASGRVLTSPPETHIFANHQDLVNFLGDELGHGDDAIRRDSLSRTPECA